MIAKENIELQENSSVKLTLTVEQGVVKKEFDALLEKYVKTISMKGFRKGKVPASILMQKFGDSLKSEATANIVEGALTEALKDSTHPPLSYCSPKLEEEVLIDPEKDFTFAVTYDVYPEIKLYEYEGTEIEVPAWSILKEDVDRELEYLRDQNSLIVEKEDGKKLENKDIVSVTYVELDEADREIEDTKREDFVFTIGSGYNPYKIDEDLLGMMKDEEKIIEKSFPEDYSVEELKGTTKRIKVKITAIKVKELPDLDDELAQDIGEEETLEDLKKALKKDLTARAKKAIKSLKRTALVAKIIEGTEVSLPKSMVQIALEDSWQNFVDRSAMKEAHVIDVLKRQNKEKAQLMEEWKDGAEKSIKAQLIFTKLAEEEKITISPEEWEEVIKRQADAFKLTIEEAREQIENSLTAANLRKELSDEKLFGVLLKKITVKTGERVPFLDLVGEKQ